MFFNLFEVFSHAAVLFGFYFGHFFHFGHSLSPRATKNSISLKYLIEVNLQRCQQINCCKRVHNFVLVQCLSSYPLF